METRIERIERLADELACRVAEQLIVAKPEEWDDPYSERIRTAVNIRKQFVNEMISNPTAVQQLEIDRRSEQIKANQWQKISVYELFPHLSKRAQNCITKSKMRTLKDLCDTNTEELYKLRNFGKHTLTDLLRAINEHRIEFGIPADYPVFGIVANTMPIAHPISKQEDEDDTTCDEFNAYLSKANDN